MAFIPNLRQLGAAATVAMLVFILSAVGALADEQSEDPGKPVALRGSMSGTLQGNGAGGRFVYYSFPYAGDDSTATINLNGTPDDLSMSDSELVGFNAYAPNGDLAAWSGQQPGLNPNLSGNLISMMKGTYLVQVFNYSDRPMGFTIGVGGLPALAIAAPMAAAPSMAAPAMAATQTAQSSDPAKASMLVLDKPITGTLSARNTETFYRFAYPGGNATYTVSVNVTPDDPALFTEGLVGFNAYGPTGDLVAWDGVQTGLNPNVSGDLNNTAAGTYTLQLYNYGGRDIGYTLWISPGK